MFQEIFSLYFHEIAAYLEPDNLFKPLSRHVSALYKVPISK